MQHNYEVRFGVIRVDDELIDAVRAILIEEKKKHDPKREGTSHCTAAGDIVVAFNAHIPEENLQTYAKTIAEKIWKTARKTVDLTVTFVNLDDPKFAAYELNIEEHDYSGQILDTIREGASTEIRFGEDEFNEFFDSHV